jgi:hypothetical protein
VTDGEPTRRDVLRALVAIGVLGPWSAVACGDDPEFRWLFESPGEAAFLGGLYLAAAPGEADPARLQRVLGLDAARDRAGGADALERLRARHRADFAEGDVVVLQGWLLSRTELRMCALVQLSTPARPS